jgi:hypothetical protein
LVPIKETRKYWESAEIEARETAAREQWWRDEHHQHEEAQGKVQRKREAPKPSEVTDAILDQECPKLEMAGTRLKNEGKV